MQSDWTMTWSYYADNFYLLGKVSLYLCISEFNLLIAHSTSSFKPPNVCSCCKMAQAVGSPMFYYALGAAFVTSATSIRNYDKINNLDFK